MALTLRLRQVMRRAGITGRPPAHGWRHTAATVLVEGGTHVKTVQARLGHTTAAFTLAPYVHRRRARLCCRRAPGDLIKPRAEGVNSSR